MRHKPTRKALSPSLSCQPLHQRTAVLVRIAQWKWNEILAGLFEFPDESPIGLDQIDAGDLER